MTEWHVAQLNVGRSVGLMDDPRMHGFASRLDEINAIADRAPGFVWRLQSDGGNATDIHVTDDPLFIINLSVWRSIDELHAFTYRSDHKELFKLRRHWFEPHGEPNMVIWWLQAGTIPSVEEALARLGGLTEHGPTPDAFTFKQRFPPPEAAVA